MNSVRKQQLATVGIFLLLLSSCGAEVQEAFQQVDRVGRPLVQLALATSNERIAEWNAITPDRDIGSLGIDIRAEITTNLGNLSTAATASGFTPTAATAVIEGFLPDVLRIDLTVVSGYNLDSVVTTDGSLILTGGRRLTDDVGDIMMSYLFRGDFRPGNTFIDNVSFTGAAGNINLQGHTAVGNSFPFLALPQ